jgi:hypothetical protein
MDEFGNNTLFDNQNYTWTLLDILGRCIMAATASCFLAFPQKLEAQHNCWALPMQVGMLMQWMRFWLASGMGRLGRRLLKCREGISKSLLWAPSMTLAPHH